MITIQQYAAKVGATSRKMRDGADPFHKAYVGATPEQQADLRRRWMLGHITGGLNVTEKAAERILSRGKGAGANAEHIKAIDRASSDFRYMVVRPDSDGSAMAEPVRISRAHRQAAKSYLAQFDSLSAAIAALKAVAP
jgi:hypothetical protein